MNFENHFLCPRKFLRFVNKKMDRDVVRSMQLLTERIVSDIINRSALLCKHRGGDTIEKSDMCIVIEKYFDYGFGGRQIQGNVNPPTNEHLERIAEISRQNK